LRRREASWRAKQAPIPALAPVTKAQDMAN